MNTSTVILNGERACTAVFDRYRILRNDTYQGNGCQSASPPQNTVRFL
jgi:hypothetical protein